MSAYALSGEMASIRTRTYRAIGVSVVAHVLLLGFLSLYRGIHPGPLVLTEITFLEPGDGLAAVASAAAAVAPSPQRSRAARVEERPGVAMKSHPEDVQFPR